MRDHNLLRRIHRLFPDEIGETWINRPRRRHGGKSYRDLANDPGTVSLVHQALDALEKSGRQAAIADV